MTYKEILRIRIESKSYKEITFLSIQNLTLITNHHLILYRLDKLRIL